MASEPRDAQDVLALLDEPNPEQPGRFETSTLELRWGDEGVEATRLEGPVRLDHVLLTADNIASIQLHRAIEQEEPGWLARIVGRAGRERTWICAQLRGKRGERLRFSSVLPPKVSAAEISVAPREGTVLEWSVLFDMLAWARALGGRLVYMEASEEQERAALEVDVGAGHRDAVQEAPRDAALESGSLRDRILARLRARGLGDIVRRVSGLRSERARLERELDEVEGRISKWDRAVFFSDTPDEARAKTIKKEVKRLKSEIEEAESFISPIYKDVGDAYPVFGIGVELERLTDDVVAAFWSRRESACAEKKGRRKLREAFEALSQRVRTLYLPNVDWNAMASELVDEARCRELAQNGMAQPPEHPTLGVSPLEPEDCAAMLARALTRQGFHTSRNALPTELPADEQQQSRFVLELERSQLRLYESFAVYPPLHFEQLLFAILGVVERLENVRATVLLEDSGRPGEHDTVAWGALLLEALEQAQARYEMFGIPMPRDAAAVVAGVELEPDRRRPDGVVGLGLRCLDAEAVAEERQRLLMHARLWTNAERERQGLSVPFGDKLAFWSRSSAQNQKQIVELRIDFNKRRCEQGWPALLQTARNALAQVIPFALRDWALLAAHAAQNMGVGSSGEVRNQRRVLEALERLHKILGTTYRLNGLELGAFMKAVFDAQPQRLRIRDQGSPSYFRVLPHETLAALVASNIEHAAYRETYRRLSEDMRAFKQKQANRNALGNDLGFWDRLNVFSSDVKTWRNLGNETQHLSKSIQERHAALLEHFRSALWAYPPLWLRERLSAVAKAVSTVSHFVTQHGVHLRGQGDAMRLVHHWTGALLKAYGYLPSAEHMLIMRAATV